MTMPDLVTVEALQNGIFACTIRRPAAKNALNRAVLIQLKKAILSLETNADARVIILRGEGSFIAGADLSEMKEMSSAMAVEYSRLGHDVTLRMELSSKIWIAQVEKFALGGGLEMALGCDLIVAGESALIGLPEVTLGVIPGFGGNVRLSKWIGAARARWMIFTGQKIKAIDAAPWGLISLLVPDESVASRTEELALQIATHSSSALTRSKQLMGEFSEVHGVNYKLDSEARLFAGLFGQPDQREGMNAFFEKRKPSFNKG